MTKRVSKKRLVVDQALFEQNIHVPDYLDEVWDFPDGNFSLIKGNREIGIGFKVTDTRGCPHLYWIRLRDLRRFARKAEPHIMQAITSRALPPQCPVTL